MAINISWNTITIYPRFPFAIARSKVTSYKSTIVTIEADGVTGMGEACAATSFGDSPEQVVKSLHDAGPLFSKIPTDNADEWYPWLEKLLPDSTAARSAVDMALWDIKGKRESKSVAEMIGTPAIKYKSSYTVSLAEPDKLPHRLEKAIGYPIKKIKMGGKKDVESIDILREHQSGTYRIDGTEGWTYELAGEIIPMLDTLTIDVIEQPLKRGNLDDVAKLREISPVPLLADEDCLNMDDLQKLPGHYDGINIKLGKCGGITTALKMMQTARDLDLEVMAGCMVETSLASTAMGHIAGFADYIDLDGSILLRKDPFQGMTNDFGSLKLPTGPGLGVSPRK